MVKKFEMHSFNVLQYITSIKDVYQMNFWSKQKKKKVVFFSLLTSYE